MSYFNENIHHLAHRLLESSSHSKHNWLSDKYAWCQHGLEKEGLRSNASGMITQSHHPACLGSPLTHPNITTDYSESLLEFITPPQSKHNTTLEQLQQLHQWVYHCENQARIWPASMPCAIEGEDSIRIAEYGSSNSGKMKHIYRRGLHWRYGRIMQSIAGIHYNFSFSDDFWQALYALSEQDTDFKTFRSAAYMGLIRNFQRYAWLLIYLYGASPAVDTSFFDGKAHHLTPHKQRTAYSEFSTCLRMSDLGYKSQAQKAISLCYNHLETYIGSIQKAMQTPYMPYERIGVKVDGEYRQLNANLLQIENEFYSEIRPKATPKRGQSPSQALIKHGIEYIEVRVLDINPMLSMGIDAQQMQFIDAFLMHCLLSPSPLMDKAEIQQYKLNNQEVATRGRAPDAVIRHGNNTSNLGEYAHQLLSTINITAQILDHTTSSNIYSKACLTELNKAQNPDTLPSAQVITKMKQNNFEFVELMTHLANEHKQHLCRDALKEHVINAFKQQAKQSHAQQAQIEQNDTVDFETYLATYNQSDRSQN